MRSASTERDTLHWLRLLLARYVLWSDLAWECHHIIKAERHVALAEKWAARRRARSAVKPQG